MKKTRIDIRFGIIIVMAGFGIMGSGLPAPALPQLIAPFNVGPESVGLVLSVYTIAAAMTLPFIGYFIHHQGCKKVGIVCLLLDGVFGLLCAMATSFSFLLVCRFLQGMGIAGLVPVAMTLIRDWFKEQKRLRAMGILSGAISLSAVIIPLIGGFLGSFHWRFPFLVYGLSIVLALLFSLFVPESKIQENDKNNAENMMTDMKTYLRALLKTLYISQVRQVFLNAIVLYFLLYTMVTFLPLFLTGHHHLNTTIAGFALSVQGVFASIVASQAVRAEELLGKKRKMVIGYLFISMALMVLPCWPNVYYLMLSLLLFGTGKGLIQPAIYNQAATVGTLALSGAIISLFNTTKYFGMSLSPFLLRYLHRYFGLAWVFVTCGIMTALWAFFLRWRRQM